jgi:hypothetical protein
LRAVEVIALAYFRTQFGSGEPKVQTRVVGVAGTIGLRIVRCVTASSESRNRNEYAVRLESFELFVLTETCECLVWHPIGTKALHQMAPGSMA